MIKKSWILGCVIIATMSHCESAFTQSDVRNFDNLKTCLSGRYPTLCKRHLLSDNELQEVDGAEHRENLKTCLTGRYPTLCKKSNLKAEEAKQVLAAEKRENLNTCLTGRYKSLCKRDLLSETEQKQVLAAELSENLRTCLTGQFPSLCNKSILNSGQLAQALAAETQVAESRKHAIVQEPLVTRSYSSCESGHWVDSVSDDGQIVKLEDGSVWKVDTVDTVDSSLWLPVTDIVACGNRLINTEDNETVGATRIR